MTNSEKTMDAQLEEAKNLLERWSKDNPEWDSRTQSLIEAAQRIARAEERERAEKMKREIGAMCGIPNAGEACRAILNYLQQTND